MTISRTGVLFEGDRFLKVHTPCQLDLELPLKIRGDKAVWVSCIGEVVRVDGVGCFAVTLAASITEFEFVRIDIVH